MSVPNSSTHGGSNVTPSAIGTGIAGTGSSAALYAGQPVIASVLLVVLAIFAYMMLQQAVVRVYRRHKGQM